MGPLPKLPPCRALLDTPTAEERQISSSCLPFKCDVTAFHYQNLPCILPLAADVLGILVCVPWVPSTRSTTGTGRDLLQGQSSTSLVACQEEDVWNPPLLSPLKMESPQITPLRASVTESPSSRSDPPAALSVRGLAWGGGGGWGSRVHGIKVVLRTRYQEGFHLALPVTFSPSPLPKSLRSLVLKVWSWDSSISFTWQLVKNAPQAWCIKAGVEPSNL